MGSLRAHSAVHEWFVVLGCQVFYSVVGAASAAAAMPSGSGNVQQYMSLPGATLRTLTTVVLAASKGPPSAALAR